MKSLKCLMFFLVFFLSIPSMSAAESATESATESFNDSIFSTKIVSTDGSLYYGEIENNSDFNNFLFDVELGCVYSIEAISLNYMLIPRITLYNADAQKEIKLNCCDEAGSSFFVNWEADFTGQALVVVEGLNNINTGSYTLSITGPYTLPEISASEETLSAAAAAEGKGICKKCKTNSDCKSGNCVMFDYRSNFEKRCIPAGARKYECKIDAGCFIDMSTSRYIHFYSPSRIPAEHGN